MFSSPLYRLGAGALLGVLLSLKPGWAADTSGCGKSHDYDTKTHTISSSGQDRQFLVHIPAAYDGGSKHSVIVAYHGRGETGSIMESNTGLDDSKYSQHSIVVYPDGVSKSWAGANYSETTINEDLQFTEDLLTEVRDNYCVDPSKVYATGMSNGGGFVSILACDNNVGGQFAAFAPISGAYYWDDEGLNRECNPAGGLAPILEIHGGDDQTAFYGGGGGNGGTLPSIPDW